MSYCPGGPVVTFPILFSYPFNKRSSGSSFGSTNNNNNLAGGGETVPFLQSSLNSREGNFREGNSREGHFPGDDSFQTQTGSSSHYEVIPAMAKKFGGGVAESDTSGNAATTSDEEEVE